MIIQILKKIFRQDLVLNIKVSISTKPETGNLYKVSVDYNLLMVI